MVREIKERIQNNLQKIDVLNKRLDDKIEKNIVTPIEVKDVANRTRKLVAEIAKYIDLE